ncbi:uncharacterized protein EI90DRAFT_3034043 [Cantharellus anzutake]|uniref:uncharacterized protein n=1 Tax=Cantharellus anzutake TaxID=1750568 RepID=UPI0019059669|nr:uncharacterized protein EI90DRAFT_3034043 [Cantharellus anzutake]KAF8341467.1 hypothetical protein EI90DRAFT_3034043 [Cantharellus anzutake]
MRVARQLVPKEYGLLQIDKTLLPNFPTDKFPVIVRGGTTFNITVSGISTQDDLFFAISGIFIPFVDRLKNDRTPFIYNAYLFQDNVLTVAPTMLGAGSITYLSSIDPPGRSNRAYYLNNRNNAFAFQANALAGGWRMMFDFFKTDSGPWGIGTFLGIANLPAFGPLSVLCYRHIEYDPKSYFFVQGDVSFNVPSLSSTTFQSVTGLTAYKLFQEDLSVPCSHFGT